MKTLDRLKTSSKWQTGAAALLFAIGQPLWTKWGMSEEAFANSFYALLAVIGAQGMADLGKEKD